MIKDDIKNPMIYLWKGHKISKGAYEALTFDIQWKEDIERRVVSLEKAYELERLEALEAWKHGVDKVLAHISKRFTEFELRVGEIEIIKKVVMENFPVQCLKTSGDMMKKEVVHDEGKTVDITKMYESACKVHGNMTCHCQPVETESTSYSGGKRWCKTSPEVKDSFNPFHPRDAVKFSGKMSGTEVKEEKPCEHEYYCQFCGVGCPTGTDIQIPRALAEESIRTRVELPNYLYDAIKTALGGTK